MRFGRTTSRARQRLARLFRARDDERAVATALGPDHELGRVLARRRALTRQLVVTSIVLALAGVGTALHATYALGVLVATGVVDLVLAVAVAHFRSRTRDVSIELIAFGDESALAVGPVRSESRRLSSRNERERIAHSLERLLHDAQRWHRILPAYRPPEGTQLLRFAADEVCEVVALLRRDSVPLRGVALAARLLLDGYRSPLYAGNVDRLREELNRIRYLLQVPREADPAHVWPSAA